MESKSKLLGEQKLAKSGQFAVQERSNMPCDTVSSRNEIRTESLRVELAMEEYAVLAKRAAQEGMTTEALVAQAVGKLLQQ